jgi:hypothetical protein
MLPRPLQCWLQARERTLTPARMILWPATTVLSS